MTAAASVRFATSSASRMVATCALSSPRRCRVPRRYLPVRPSLRHQVEHLELARREGRRALASPVGRWRRGRRRGRRGRENQRRQVHAAGQDESQRGEQDGRARRLGNESRGAPVDGGADVGVPLRGRHDHHRKRRKALAQHAERGEPVHAGHSEVQEDEIRIRLGVRDAKRLLRARRIEQLGRLLELAEHETQAGAEQRVVVADQDPSSVTRTWARSLVACSSASISACTSRGSTQSDSSTTRSIVPVNGAGGW